MAHLEHLDADVLVDLGKHDLDEREHEKLRRRGLAEQRAERDEHRARREVSVEQRACGVQHTSSCITARSGVTQPDPEPGPQLDPEPLDQVFSVHPQVCSDVQGCVQVLKLHVYGYVLIEILSAPDSPLPTCSSTR